MNELTFWEVVARIKPNETYKCTNSVRINEISTDSDCNIRFKFDEPRINQQISRYDRFKLKKIIKPVTFSEAVSSMKKVRFDRRIDEDVESEDPEINKCLSRYSKGEYLYLADIMSVLGYMYTSDDIKDIMGEDWYIEGE